MKLLISIILSSIILIGSSVGAANRATSSFPRVRDIFDEWFDETSKAAIILKDLDKIVKVKLHSGSTYKGPKIKAIYINYEGKIERVLFNDGNSVLASEIEKIKIRVGRARFNFLPSEVYFKKIYPVIIRGIDRLSTAEKVLLFWPNNKTVMLVSKFGNYINRIDARTFFRRSFDHRFSLEEVIKLLMARIKELIGIDDERGIDSGGHGIETLF